MKRDERDFVGRNVGVLAIGEGRTLEADPSARRVVEILDSAGHRVAVQRAVPDASLQLRAALLEAIADPGIDVVVLLAPAPAERLLAMPSSPPAVPPPSEEPPWLANAPMPAAATVMFPPLQPRRGGLGRATVIGLCGLAAAAAALIGVLQLRGGPSAAAGASAEPREQRGAIAAAAGGPATPAAAPATPASAPRTPASPIVTPVAELDVEASATERERERAARTSGRTDGGDAGKRVAAVTAPSVTAPPVTMPSVSAPPAIAPSATAPSVTAPVATAPVATEAESPRPTAAATTGPAAQVAEEPGPAPATPDPSADAAASQVGATSPGACDEVDCVLTGFDRPCCARFRPATREPAPASATGEDLPDKLDRRMIQTAMAAIKQVVTACGTRHDGRGTVSLRVRVDPSGTVADVTVRSAPDEALGACVADATRKARFAKTSGGGSFGYPFVF